MLLKLLLIAVVTYSALASEELLQSLCGVHGGNRVTLCMDPGSEQEECDGVIWQRSWVLVRGSCVVDKAMYPVIVQRTSAPCASVATDEEVTGSRKVRARFLHPSFPATDISLLNLDRAYDLSEPLRNDSSAALYKLEPWLTDIVSQYSHNASRAKYNLYSSKRKIMFSSPIKMFMTTVVLPLTSFIVFFLFVTFFTGSKKSTLPYKSLCDDKEDSMFA